MWRAALRKPTVSVGVDPATITGFAVKWCGVCGGTTRWESTGNVRTYLERCACDSADRCWRCDAHDATTTIGLCSPCRADLAG